MFIFLMLLNLSFGYTKWHLCYILPYMVELDFVAISSIVAVGCYCMDKIDKR